MFKKMLVFLICLCFFTATASAGVVKKITGVGASYLIKYEAKKIVKAKAKKSVEKLVKNEMKVNTYGKLTSLNKALKKTTGKSIENDAHHIPSQKFMEKLGIDPREAIAINMEKIRHSLTRTYKGRNVTLLKGNETPREALARDIKNLRDIYRYEKKELLQKGKNESGSDFRIREKKYESDLREAAKDVIKRNKDKFPKHFNK